MIRDIIVVGTNSRKIWEKLINEGKDLILDKAIYIARAHELSQSQMKLMEESEEVVHIVKRDHITRRKGCLAMGANHLRYLGNAL